MKKRSREEIEVLVQEYQRSGTNVAQFARDRGLNPQQMYQYLYDRGIRRNRSIAPVREVVVEQNGNDAKKVKDLQNEILRLKILVAEQALDIQALKEYSGRT